MICNKNTIGKFLDGLILVIVFLFQSVILNYFVINQFIQSSLTFLWFLGDFLTLLLFGLTLYVAFRFASQSTSSLSKLGESTVHLSRTNSRNTQNSNFKSTLNFMNCCSNPTQQTPLIYLSWIFYSSCLIAKIIILFKGSNSPATSINKEDDFFGPQILKIAISLAAILFSLLVEAHLTNNSNFLRNAYIKQLSFGMALEILDSVSFLSILIVPESHLVYTFHFQDLILSLCSINLLLPAIALYKLSVSGFGEDYVLPIELLYKLLHLLLVNVPYLSVRLYLWKYYSYSDTSVFIVKNIYGIVALLRTIGPDLKKLYLDCQQKRRRNMNRRDASQESPVPNIMNSLLSNNSQSSSSSLKNGKESSERNEKDALYISMSSLNANKNGKEFFKSKNGNEIPIPLSF